MNVGDWAIVVDAFVCHLLLFSALRYMFCVLYCLLKGVHNSQTFLRQQT